MNSLEALADELATRLIRTGSQRGMAGVILEWLRELHAAGALFPGVDFPPTPPGSPGPQRHG